MRHQPNSPGTSITTARGRPFVTGNPGRKPGPRNRTTIVAAALLEGDAEALTRKAIELALAGDVGMLKFLLGRILPRERPLQLDLPAIQFADDAVEALGAVIRAVSEGKLSASEGAALATMMKSFSQAIDLADVVKRLELARGTNKWDRGRCVSIDFDGLPASSNWPTLIFSEDRRAKSVW